MWMCSSSSIWSARSIVKPGSDTIIDAPVCNITDLCYPKATTQFMSSVSIREAFCADCQQECTKTLFSMKTSSLAAPVDWLIDPIKAFVENSSIPLPTDWSTSWRTYIQNNYVAVDVVQESIQVENYTQDSTISRVDVLSNVGGHTGLWIGMSFFSLMEIAEMLYLLIHYQLYLFRVALRNKQQANEKSTETS
jgi:hypothetical protein